jgi:hypothetical protein
VSFFLRRVLFRHSHAHRYSGKKGLDYSLAPSPGSDKMIGGEKTMIESRLILDTENHRHSYLLTRAWVDTLKNEGIFHLRSFVVQSGLDWDRIILAEIWEHSEGEGTSIHNLLDR